MKGECAWCHGPLVGKQRQWCSKKCSAEFVRNHAWSYARPYALRAANKRCSLCGAPDSWEQTKSGGRSFLEVNHVVPVAGDRRSYDCQNHQDNLQVVCRPCHVAITNQQRRDGMFKKPVTDPE